jgi:hypothetical protein
MLCAADDVRGAFLLQDLAEGILDINRSDSWEPVLHDILPVNFRISLRDETGSRECGLTLSGELYYV